MDRLAEIEQRFAKTTPHPWSVRRSLPGVRDQSISIVNPAGDAEAGDWMVAERVRWAEDAELIAHAPSDLVWLIGEVKDLRAKLAAEAAKVAQMRAALKAMQQLAYRALAIWDDGKEATAPFVRVLSRLANRAGDSAIRSALALPVSDEESKATEVTK